MAKFILDQKRTPIIGRGQAIGSNIHVQSLTELFLQLFEEAMTGESDDLLWGAEAYYLVEQGEHCWGDVAHSIGLVAVGKGYLSSVPEPILVDKKTAFELAGFEATSWGSNMRCRATKARSILHWQPGGGSLDEELPGIVDAEFVALKK
ncbi:nucleoside-diphosphate-sugar epimerase [Penicillium capsulatum]|uniref:Nucleoside-diphosphate-sugar epimerase n=1 Tax=Penicillium capsulatum TaxID=69766 RepID=A0A9W9I8A3_9EURO|nr:nucleoside-diphosphate-sugar epimerase [Penicillium capsulatum]